MSAAKFHNLAIVFPNSNLDIARVWREGNSSCLSFELILTKAMDFRAKYHPLIKGAFKVSKNPLKKVLLMVKSFDSFLPHYEFQNCHHTTFDSFAGMDTDSDDYFGDGSDLVDLALGQGLNCWVWPHWPNWVVTIVRYQDCFGNVP